MIDILACPIDKHYPLELLAVKEGREVDEGALHCESCSRFYPIIDGIPILLPDELRDKRQDMNSSRGTRARCRKRWPGARGRGTCDRARAAAPKKRRAQTAQEMRSAAVQGAPTAQPAPPTAS